MNAKAVFEGFTEGEISFQPTYKYDAGCDEWDTRYSDCFICDAPVILEGSKNKVEKKYRNRPCSGFWQSSVLPCIVIPPELCLEAVIFISVLVRSAVFQLGVIGYCGKGRTLLS